MQAVVVGMRGVSREDEFTREAGIWFEERGLAQEIAARLPNIRYRNCLGASERLFQAEVPLVRPRKRESRIERVDGA